MKDGRERIGLAGSTLFFCHCQTIQSQDQHQQLALVCQYFATGSYLRHKSKRINIFLKQVLLVQNVTQRVHMKFDGDYFQLWDTVQ